MQRSINRNGLRQSGLTLGSHLPAQLSKDRLSAAEDSNDLHEVVYEEDEGLKSHSKQK